MGGGGNAINNSRTNLFNHTINICKLIDLGFNGPKFTWTNKRKINPIFERLDRGFGNDEWLTKYPNSCIWHLPRISSDHAPILCTMDNIPKLSGVKPFRFEPMWIQDPSFEGVVHEAWVSEEGPISAKIRRVGNDLSVWNTRTFGNVYVKKKRVLARLKGIQNYLQFNPDSIYHLNLEDTLQSEFMDILMQEEWLWLAKSRIEWINQGDTNTAFFHRSVLIKRQRSTIRSLKDNMGNIISDPSDLEALIRMFYIDLCSTEKTENLRASLQEDPNQINLVTPPSDHEIKNAMFSMKPLKAPGPNGFHPIFFQREWHIVGEEICTNIIEWFRKGSIPDELGQALICLIPKQDNPENVKQLRPISLCNTVYKLVTKILVTRMKPYMPKWVSENQNGFIQGRGIDINLTVASEVLHSMYKKKGKLGWFALKVDLEKAYDRIEWDFVRTCLANHNLNSQSINFIMNCINKAKSTVLVNGKKTEPFNHTRGLRQGDPMSPFLFNICLEHLTGLINQACLQKLWTPFWVGKAKVPISHLMFADDLLIFGRVDESTTFTLRQIMQTFCEMSGQKINEGKSRLTFSPNTMEEHKVLFQETMNIKESESLGLYLGLPLSHLRPKRREVQFVVEKVRRKLALWKTKFLSRAGRLVMIKSSMNSVASYYMQVTQLPKTTLKELDQICNDFLWGDVEGKKTNTPSRTKPHLPAKTYGRAGP